MFFVMLSSQDGKTPLLMVETVEGSNNERIALFHKELDAEKAAEGNILGAHFGYQVYEW